MSSRPPLDFRPTAAAFSTDAALHPGVRNPHFANGAATSPQKWFPSSTVAVPESEQPRLFHEGIEYVVPPTQESFAAGKEAGHGLALSPAASQESPAQFDNNLNQQQEISLHVPQDDKFEYVNGPVDSDWPASAQLAPPPPTPTPSPPPPPPAVLEPMPSHNWPKNSEGVTLGKTLFDRLLQQLAEEHRRVLAELDLAQERHSAVPDGVAKVRHSYLHKGAGGGHSDETLGNDKFNLQASPPVRTNSNGFLDHSHCDEQPEPVSHLDEEHHAGSRTYPWHLDGYEYKRFQLLPHWQDVNSTKQSLQMADSTESRQVFEDILQSGNVLDKLHANYTSCLQKFIALPSSPRRLMWDLLGALLLIFDIITVPMLVFTPPQNQFTRTMDWVTMMFWTADMGASLLVGYIDKGFIIMSPWGILKNYLKTWFVVDLVTVGPDWAMMMLESVNGSSGGNSNPGKSVKLMRMVRFVRVLRLMRLTKLKRVLVLIHDHLDSEYMFVVVKIVKLLLFMVIVNHFLGCLWYLVGVASISLGDRSNWIDHYNMNERLFGYQYTTSVHWAMTQFTPGSMHVQPQNTGERAFAITVLLLGMVIFSSFISSMTAATTQLRGMQEDTWKQFWLLRRYLRQQGVPNTLAFRIQRFVEYATTNRQDMVNIKQVKILDMLSEQLRLELRLATTTRPLMEHPLFRYLSEHYEVAMQRLCAAISSRCYAAGDFLFFPGDDATHMLLLVSGELMYSVTFEETEQRRKAPVSLEGRLEESVTKFPALDAGDWIGEHVLWIQWKYVGTLVATGESELVTIDAASFAQIALKQVEVVCFLARYAAEFYRWICQKQPRELIDVLFAESGAETVSKFLPERAQTSQRASLQSKQLKRSTWRRTSY